MSRIEERTDLLLTRDEFREAVFARDGGKCVMCPSPAADAHHVVERRLYSDGGYYVSNGASVCPDHHLVAEQTLLSCEEVRVAAGIETVLLPPQFYSGTRIDKWGNEILPNGQRLRGELFDDPSVQKILVPVLHLFTNRVKYPRTFHFPWSQGITSDDRVMQDTQGFEGREVVVTVKMDGEGTTLYRDGLHARSIDYHAHPSRNWVRALHARVGYEIPDGWRVTGENLYGAHSIQYRNLQSYFLVFGVWNERNEALAWDDTVVWAGLLDLQVVPVLYRGPWDEQKIRGLYSPEHAGDECEGYVVRVVDQLHAREFSRVVGKFVRCGHVKTHESWLHRNITVNGLRKEGNE